MIKIIEFLWQYASIPGGILLGFFEPSIIVKKLILITYLVASVSGLIYGYVHKKPSFMIASAFWCIIEVIGLIFPGFKFNASF